MKYNPRDENSIKAVMAKSNVVLNLIGMGFPFFFPIFFFFRILVLDITIFVDRKRV